MKEFEAHILIVDDDKGIRELVKEYLDQNNFITSTAENAWSAAEKTKLIKSIEANYINKLKLFA